MKYTYTLLANVIIRGDTDLPEPANETIHSSVFRQLAVEILHPNANVEGLWILSTEAAKEEKGNGEDGTVHFHGVLENLAIVRHCQRRVR